MEWPYTLLQMTINYVQNNIQACPGGHAFTSLSRGMGLIDVHVHVYISLSRGAFIHGGRFAIIVICRGVQQLNNGIAHQHFGSSTVPCCLRQFIIYISTMRANYSNLQEDVCVSYI